MFSNVLMNMHTMFMYTQTQFYAWRNFQFKGFALSVWSLRGMPRRLSKKTPAAESGYAQVSIQDEALNPTQEKNGNTQTKFWVFTTTGEPPKFEAPMKFLIYQKEMGAKTGMVHYQGYVELETKVRFKTALSILGMKMYKKGEVRGPDDPLQYLAYRWGGQHANIRYCSSTWYCKTCSAGDAEGYPEYKQPCKEGCTSARSKGKCEATQVFGKPGTELLTQEMHLHVRKRLLNGCPKSALYMDHPEYSARFTKWIDRQHQAFAPQRSWQPLVYWFYGPSGTDKSRIANAVCTSTYFKAPDTKWFDGYDNQTVVVFNDFRKSTFTFSYLLDLLDRYSFAVEVKCAVVNMAARCFIFTSSKSHSELWSEIAGQQNENLYQLTRRITKEVRFPLSSIEKAELVTEMRLKIKEKLLENSKDDLYGTWSPNDPVPAAEDLLPVQMIA